jgi:hypothetical protein
MGAEAAMRVPAFARATRLISGTVAQLPLTQWRGTATVPGTGLLAQPEPDVPVWVTLQRLVEDLAHYGRGYWEVRDLDANGYPTRVRLLAAANCTEDANRPGMIQVADGQGRTRLLPVSHPAGPGSAIGSVIVFTGYRNGVLTDGWDVIENALAWERAAQHYAEYPLPQIALKNEGADMPPEDVNALLTAWEAARADRSTAYLNSVMSAESFGWSAADLALTDARNTSAVQIARLFNLDPMWVGASIPGSSLSYANRVDMRKDLIDLTLSDYMSPIEQRLSMHDVTPTVSNNLVRFSTNEFLRSNLEARAAMVAQLLPLGVITEDEARDFLRDTPTPIGYPS